MELQKTTTKKTKKIKLGRNVTDTTVTPLQEFISKKGITQQELAVRTGLTKQFINSLCRGRNSFPNSRTQQRVAVALGVKVRTIFD